MKTMLMTLAFVFALSVQAQHITVGVCTNIENVQLLHSAQCDYIEVGIQGFLMPEKSDSLFSVHEELAKTSLLPLFAANSFFLLQYLLPVIA